MSVLLNNVDVDIFSEASGLRCIQKCYLGSENAPHTHTWIECVSEVICDSLDRHTPAQSVLPQLHVGAVGEGESEEDSCKQHLYGDEEVLIGG